MKAFRLLPVFFLLLTGCSTSPREINRSPQSEDGNGSVGSGGIGAVPGDGCNLALSYQQNEEIASLREELAKKGYRIVPSKTLTEALDVATAKVFGSTFKAATTKMNYEVFPRDREQGLKMNLTLSKLVTETYAQLQVYSVYSDYVRNDGDNYKTSGKVSAGKRVGASYSVCFWESPGHRLSEAEYDEFMNGSEATNKSHDDLINAGAASERFFLRDLPACSRLKATRFKNCEMLK